jgi:ketosteroid isomerase-like protein
VGTPQEPPLLLDRQALADLVIRYAAALDEKDVDALRELFDPQVEVVGFSHEPIRGVDAWLGFVAAQLGRFHATQHMLGPSLAEIEGDRATTRTELQATHWMRDPAGQVFTLYGTYVTQMVRSPRGWRIVRHTLVVRGTQGNGF